MKALNFDTLCIDGSKRLVVDTVSPCSVEMVLVAMCLSQDWFQQQGI